MVPSHLSLFCVGACFCVLFSPEEAKLAKRWETKKLPMFLGVFVLQMKCAWSWTKECRYRAVPSRKDVLSSTSRYAVTISFSTFVRFFFLCVLRRAFIMESFFFFFDWFIFVGDFRAACPSRALASCAFYSNLNMQSTTHLCVCELNSCLDQSKKYS